MDPKQRREQGAHYTTEKNILKVIEPLFMDDLRANFERLKARAMFPNSPLDVLYDRDAMPPALRKAHRVLDRAVDRLYRRTGFGSERERVEYLFMLYEKLQTPLVSGLGEGVPRPDGNRETMIPAGDFRHGSFVD